jgi:hypothetical protein
MNPAHSIPAARVLAEVRPAPRSRAWLWLVALMLLQVVAWTAWFLIAARHHVAEVPLQKAAHARGSFVAELQAHAINPAPHGTRRG